MKILDGNGRPFKFYRMSPRCNICKRRIEWKLENGKHVPYLLTGEKDTCYSKKI